MTKSWTTVYLATPRKFFDRIHQEFQFTIDVAASDKYHMVPRYYTEEDNALVQSWANEICWCSPPWHSDVVHYWIKKCQYATAVENATVVGLYPRRETATWWVSLWQSAAEIRAIFEPGLAFEPMDTDIAMQSVVVEPHMLVVWYPWFNKYRHERKVVWIDP